MRRLLPLVLTLAALVAACVGAMRLVEIRVDMAEFLPPARNEASAFLLSELTRGTGASLVLAGLEGAPAPELARQSRALGDAMRASGRFAFVGNGAAELSEAEREAVFRHRYLLSPEVTPALFETPVLRAKLEALLDGLRSSASPLLQRIGFADPVGAFLGLLRGWTAPSRVALTEGVWMVETPQGPRAVLVARTQGQGLDVLAQQAAVAEIRAAFAAADPGAARLVVTGAGALSAEAAAVVRDDVRLISAVSGLLIAGFLLWRYRSLVMLVVVGVPLAAGTLAGVAAVVAIFGHLHGAALGFGMTMLGVAVDYPILLISQRRPRETLRRTARRIWPSLRLAAAAAAAGLVAMLASGFPGLAQLGLFAAAGLPVSAAVTRWVLPRLMGDIEIGLRPLPGALDRALLALPDWRGPILLAPAAAVLALVVVGGLRWEDDIAAISPVPEASRRLDGELRAQLGAPDVRLLVAIRLPDAESALQASERVAAALAPLVAAGVMADVDAPGRYLPSLATQRARQAALPDAAVLRARLAEAGAGMPFRPTAFERFVAGVEDSRALSPLGPADLSAMPTLAARLSPLIAPRDGAWQALVVPSDVRDIPALRATLDGLREPGLIAVEVKRETEALVAAATRRALWWSAAGALLVFWLLAAGLGGIGAAARTAAPLAGALVVTVAVLTLAGERLMLFHLVALLLLCGVGMDYALFLGRSFTGVPDEAARALRSVVNCTLTTLLTFGLLALCQTPLLRSIGLTVAIGVTAAFLLAAAMAPRGARG